MKREVKTISFLLNGERIYLHSSSTGKFKLPVVKTIGSRKRKTEKYFWPREVVEHNFIKKLDPFLTLNSGEKLRVYQGGDSTYMLTEVESILDLHREKRQVLRKKLPPTLDGLCTSLQHPWPDSDPDDIF